MFEVDNDIERIEQELNKNKELLKQESKRINREWDVFAKLIHEYHMNKPEYILITVDNSFDGRKIFIYSNKDLYITTSNFDT